jgi:sporadic carbohydrate cluster 2OG-Fe(II) oxygenase
MFSLKYSNLQKKFIKQGYAIFKIDNIQNLNYIKKKVEQILTGEKINLNNFHKSKGNIDLNKTRLKIIQKINKNNEFKLKYFNIFEAALNEIVGSEISMQKNIGLNIQTPKDSNSLIEMHADTYAGESNFEVVTWLPLVNVFKTKSMYILPIKYSREVEKNILEYNEKGTDIIYNKYRKKIKFLNLKFGEGLIFTSNVLHGNKINLTNQTRFSFNCRFKSIFSPQNLKLTNKTNSNMYSSVSLKPASIIGLEYINKI